MELGRNNNVAIHWVPRHPVVEGNQNADDLARKKVSSLDTMLLTWMELLQDETAKERKKIETLKMKRQFNDLLGNKGRLGLLTGMFQSKEISKNLA